MSIYTARAMESGLAGQAASTERAGVFSQIGAGLPKPATVFLLIPDNGYEGFGKPIAAFATEARAVEAVELIKAANGSAHRVVVVEVKP